MGKHVRVRKGWSSAAGAVLAARIFSLMAAAVQLPMLTRGLAPEEYAAVAVAIALGTYFSLLGAESTILPFQRFPGSFTDRANFAYATRQLGVILLGLSVLTLLIALSFDELTFGFGIVGWGLGLAANRFVAAAWLMWDSPWSYAGSLVLGTGFRTITLVVMVYLAADPGAAVGAAGVASAVGAAILAPKIRRIEPSDEKPWRGRFGLSLALGSLAFTVMSNFALLYLPVLVEERLVGIYAAMNHVVVLSVGAVLGLASTVLYPRLQKVWNFGGQDKVRKLVGILAHGSIALGALSMTLLSVVGMPLLELILGTAYVELNVAVVLVASIVAGQVGLFLSWLHTFSLQSAKVRNSAVTASALGCTATAAMIAIFGIHGAAWGTFISFMLYAFLMYESSRAPKSIVMSMLALISCLSIYALATPSWSIFILAVLPVVPLYSCWREFRH